MGNILVFGDRTTYVNVEASVGAALLGLTVIGIAAVFFIYCCCCGHWKEKDCRTKCKKRMKDCCKNCCACRTDETTSNQNSTDSKTPCKKCCTSCCSPCTCTSFCKACKIFFTSVKHFHRFLGYTFSSVSELYIESETHTEAGNTKIPVLIISARKVPSGCIECLNYLYFIYVFLMCGLWFIAITIEHSIYRKTGTCNDINVDARSFRCFDVDNHSIIVDCNSTPNINSIRVICYLYSPTVTGLGVAFSVAKLISIVGDIVFNIILKGTNRCAICFCVLRIFGFVLVFICLGILIWVTQTRIWDHEYFLYATIPMRVAQLILLCITALGMLVIPPCIKYTKEEYNTKYRHLGYVDVEMGKEPQDPQSQGQGHLPPHTAPHQGVAMVTIHSEHAGEERRRETSNV